MRTTDRAAAGSTRGSDASPQTPLAVLPKSVSCERSQKSITPEPAVLFVGPEHPAALAFEKWLREVYFR